MVRGAKIVGEVSLSRFFGYATGFSQWLVTEFNERRIHSAKNWMARLLPCRNFAVGLRTESRSVICF